MAISNSDLRVSSRTTWVVLLLCWGAILSEGYDVGVMGAILPVLSGDKGWALTPVQLGWLGSLALIGMLFGAALVGTLSDQYGRRRMYFLCIALFSCSMIVCALAPNPEVFGAARLVGGLGLGGIIPVAAAMTIEYSPPERRSENYGLMYSGYSLGILAAALVSIPLLQHASWHAVLGLGAVPLLILPLIARYLPESVEYLESKGRGADARAWALKLGATEEDYLRFQAHTLNRKKGQDAAAAKSVGELVAEVFGAHNLRATICFWLALFLGLLMVYGLTTWLPQIMRKSGYNLSSSLLFLAVFSLTSAIGGVVAGKVADRLGALRTVAWCYLIGAVGIALLGFKGPAFTTYVLIGVAGFGSISASLILTGLVADYYASWARASATGWALAFARVGAMCGPLLGGYLASMAIPPQWHFFVFAATAVLAFVLVMLVPPKQARTPGLGNAAVEAAE
ncbi:MFS transporter [Candidimonas humi]|uniref:Aromatic acid/H+ symport family MFS transporter n=1 Tax=Candidimonas humi TaxID=683355 RepID=A0ABV8P5V9_9BURK